jgi:hypothetical protein
MMYDDVGVLFRSQELVRTVILSLILIFLHNNIITYYVYAET